MKIARWLTFNIALITFGYFGFVREEDGARHIFLFAIWVTSVVSPALLTSTAIADLRKRGRSVPQWLGIGVDVSIMLFMVWFGAVLSATALLIRILVTEAAWKKSISTETTLRAE